MPRILGAIKDEQNVCNNFLYKNQDREKFAYFSLPLRINLPLRIIMKKTTYEKIGSPKSLSLTSFLQKTKLRGILEKDRSYSKLDTIIEKIKTDYLIKEVLTSKQMINMLFYDRMDYMIEYSMVIEKYIKELDDLVYVPIEEMKPFAYSYIACPKNKWGDKVVSDVNNALKKIVHTKEFQTLIKSLYKQKIDRNYIDKIYTNEFLNEF